MRWLVSQRQRCLPQSGADHWFYIAHLQCTIAPSPEVSHARHLAAAPVRSAEIVCLDDAVRHIAALLNEASRFWMISDSARAAAHHDPLEFAIANIQACKAHRRVDCCNQAGKARIAYNLVSGIVVALKPPLDPQLLLRIWPPDHGIDCDSRQLVRAFIQATLLGKLPSRALRPLYRTVPSVRIATPRHGVLSHRTQARLEDSGQAVRAALTDAGTGVK